MLCENLFRRVEDNLSGKIKGPYCLDLIPSNACNLNCAYCAGGDYRKVCYSITKKKIVTLLDAATKLQVKEISLTSIVGEPTLFSDIHFLMEEIKKRHFFSSLLTNGTMVDVDFAMFLEKISWDVLILSIDSFDADIQYALRPSVSQDDYLEKIKQFLDYTCSHNKTLSVNLNMVVTNLNYQGVADYFQIAEEYGVQHITLICLEEKYETKTNYKRLKLTDRQQQEFKKSLEAINTTIQFNRSEWLNDGKNGTATRNRFEKCYFPLYKMLVNHDGQILKCNGEPVQTRYHIGDGDLIESYKSILKEYNYWRKRPSCYANCCSPIKSLNQEIAGRFGQLPFRLRVINNLIKMFPTYAKTKN